MDPTRLMTIPATVTPRVVAAEPDDMGNDVLADGDSFDTFCYLWQDSHRLASIEQTGAENVTDDSYSAGFPPDDPISADSKVTIDGLDYEVVGPPWRAFNPRLRKVTHQELTLRRVA